MSYLHLNFLCTPLSDRWYYSLQKSDNFTIIFNLNFIVSELDLHKHETDLNIFILKSLTELHSLFVLKF